MCGRYTLASPNPPRCARASPSASRCQCASASTSPPGDDVLAVTTDRDGAPAGRAAALGSRAVLVQGCDHRAEDDQRPSGDGDRTTGLSPRLRALSLPDTGRRLLRVAACPHRPEAAVPHHARGRPTVRVRRAMVDLARTRRQQAAHVHDPHHSRQLGRGADARPNARDPRRRQRGDLVGLLEPSPTSCSTFSVASPLLPPHYDRSRPRSTMRATTARSVWPRRSRIPRPRCSNRPPERMRPSRNRWVA